VADQAYTVILEVPHAGGRAWRWVAAEFDEQLAAQVIPPVLAADLVSEIRRGRDGLRLRIEVRVRAGDVGQAVTLAFEALEAASDVGGFDLGAATAEAGPAPLRMLDGWRRGVHSSVALVRSLGANRRQSRPISHPRSGRWEVRRHPGRRPGRG
jgi:hypothetical protein